MWGVAVEGDKCPERQVEAGKVGRGRLAQDDLRHPESEKPEAQLKESAGLFCWRAEGTRHSQAPKGFLARDIF